MRNDLSELNVLLVDDNEIDNYIHERIFKHHGKYNCRLFRSAQSALGHLMETKIRYDYLVIDIYMPEMDGFTFIEQFNRFLLNKIHGEKIILTASLNPSHRVRAQQLGLKFMEKPFQFDSFYVS